mgnify:CR=1 FL=1
MQTTWAYISNYCVYSAMAIFTILKIYLFTLTSEQKYRKQKVSIYALTIQEVKKI